MGEWVALANTIITADVIRWTEDALQRRSKRGRFIKLGRRKLAGQITAIDGNWVFIMVARCEVIDITPGRIVPIMYKGETIKRNRRTLLQGRAERLLWSDESARSICASRFMGCVDDPATTYGGEHTSFPIRPLPAARNRSRGRKPKPPRLSP